jgi:transmembrane sensor
MGADDIRAEAAAWLARLRSDAPQAEDHAGFQAWLAESPAHQAAFEQVTAAWDLVGGAAHVHRLQRTAMPKTRRGVLIGGAIAVGTVAASAAAFGIWRGMRLQTLQTDLGMQERVTLADGSSIMLDAKSKLRVAYGSERRAIVLEYGRAFFQVAPDPLRPFVVSAGGHDVVAIGTAFDVRCEDNAVSVTLEHGRVSVSESAQSEKNYTLDPGDRIQFAEGGVKRDKAKLELTQAWRDGRLGFDREPLAEAIQELNRYSHQPLVIEDPSIAQLPISGVFTAGDNPAFARSIAQFLPVAIAVETGRIVLTAVRPEKKKQNPG